MKKFLSKQGGFTLIELMIVIAIIAILAAILIPNFVRARAQSQLSACEANLKNYATALEMYSTDWNGNYPVGAGVGSAAGVMPAASVARMSPNYMRAVPVCPTNQAGYSYNAAAAAPVLAFSLQQMPAGLTPHVSAGVAAALFPEYDSGRGLIP